MAIADVCTFSIDVVAVCVAAHYVVLAQVRRLGRGLDVLTVLNASSFVMMSAHTCGVQSNGSGQDAVEQEVTMRSQNDALFSLLAIGCAGYQLILMRF